jgi:hypothetical protein
VIFRGLSRTRLFFDSLGHSYYQTKGYNSYIVKLEIFWIYYNTVLVMIRMSDLFLILEQFRLSYVYIFI